MGIGIGGGMGPGMGLHAKGMENTIAMTSGIANTRDVTDAKNSTSITATCLTPGTSTDDSSEDSDSANRKNTKTAQQHKGVTARCCCGPPSEENSHRGSMQINIQDALVWVEQQKDETFDFVLIDIDSKDPGIGSPPAAFLEYSFLRHVRRILRPGGVMAMNVLYADQDQYPLLHHNIKRLFNSSHAIGCDTEDGGVVYGLTADHAMNRTIVRRRLEECEWGRLVYLHRAVQEYWDAFTP
eukprot:TRINITY_DN19284_c0_g1::TRINITY_DN19284_c0_g1_i1::g.15910::m.15910 TRINITY_DN19284_c0_g1::TRINITY_DN19284_c0_g1_i1::g.15910  ORF type:complete len:254 (-),score=10.52,sp/Q6NTR1/MET13_XENLA/30.48/2e-08,Spermine_synth/PF01564.12/0.0025,Methyltransf_24/PF13578.1/0.082,Methyltransf_26/PF13659.1/0.17 TRINITY_DN19284_c0_g1_i1:215-934(-)